MNKEQDYIIYFHPPGSSFLGNETRPTNHYPNYGVINQYPNREDNLIDNKDTNYDYYKV